MTRSKNPFKSKFNVAHFPVGTEFKLNEDVRFGREDDDLIRTVRNIANNGARSWVIHTGRMQLIGSHPHEEAFNLSHVEKIIRRGTGPVVIEDSRSKWRHRIREDVDMMELRGPEYKTGRGFYCTGSLNTLVVYELDKFVDPEQWYDQARIVRELCEQTWCRRHNIGRFFGWFRVNKKRLRAWLRQNEPRFRHNMDAAERHERELNEKYAQDDYDMFMDEPLGDPVPLEGNPDGGSHYDNNDPAYTGEVGELYRMSENDPHTDADFHVPDRPVLR